MNFWGKYKNFPSQLNFFIHYKRKFIMNGGNHDFTFNIRTGTLRITIYSARLVRIRFSITSEFSSKSSICLVYQPNSDESVEKEENEGFHIIKTDELKLNIDKQTGRCSILDRSGNHIVQEGNRAIKSSTVFGEEVYSVQQNFIWESNEALFGLGQFQDGKMNLRGCSRKLMQKNTVAVNPVLVSSKGYGIFWHNTSFTKFVDNSRESYLWSEVADEIDYIFIYGPTIDEVISGYRTLTGKAPMLGKWTFGYIQCKERYKSQEELLNVVKKYRELKIPLDLIVQDWRYWPKFQWGQKSFDPTRYPDPKGMIEELHKKLNTHIMISIWPKLAPQGSDYKEMESNPEFLYKIPMGGARFYDAFNKSARDLFWKQINEGLFSNGIDAWWCDATEPELAYPKLTLKKYKKRMTPSIGTGARYLNAYSQYHSKGIYENQRKVTEKKRVVNLTRSAFAGQQRFGAITWSGDISATWKVLKNQIPAGLNFCLSGIPYWTQDIGGFFVWPWKYRGGCENEKYRELYTRWLQLGAFNPLFRSHGTITPREVWQFGEPGSKYYNALVKAIKLRYSLLPYIYSLAGKVTHEDYTIMRGLVFDFAHDPKVYNIKDQFMFGSILVCPVTKPNAKTREVYFPIFKNTSRKWIDFWTGNSHEAGRTLSVDTPLNQIPLFIPSGSIIPFGPDIQYATESSDPLDIRIYPGNDAEFVLYEDENDNYNYEQGKFSQIRMMWIEKSHTFSIDRREGGFSGMLENRNFNIRINGESKLHSIQYKGDFMEIKI